MAQRAFFDWRRTTWKQKTYCFRRLSEVLRDKKETLAFLVTQEMGKPITEALAEVEKCAFACEYYAGKPEGWLGDEILLEQDPKVYVSHQPLGVIFAIMPWNFPLWQVIRFATPTLLAGNTALMKHAPNTWGSAAALAQCFLAAGFPEGVYQDFPIQVEASAKVIADPRVKGVSLTGSTRAGRAVAEQAGRHLKRCVLELGGSDPYVVLADADLKLAAQKSVQARMINGGQSCIAGKRFIVEDKVHDQFLAEVQELMSGYKMGLPEEENCRLGPLARRDLRDQLDVQVEKAVNQGARSLLPKAAVPNENGFYYPATLLSEITPDSIVFQEEFFGPVACVIRAANEKEALRLANATSFGLGAAIFSRDVQRAEILARTELEAGLCVVNGMVRSDSRWPFGGVKDSGYGRELTHFGAHEFTNLKTLIIDG